MTKKRTVPPIIVPVDSEESISTPPTHQIPEKAQAENIYIDVLQYVAFISLVSLSILGFISLIQLILIGVILDLLIMYATETMQYSLLLLPLRILDYLAALKKKDGLLQKGLGLLTITVFALGWAASQTILTLHFLPELIGCIGSAIGIVVPLLQLKVAIVAAATFTIIFRLGQKNLQHEICEEITQQNSNNYIKAGKILLFGFMYFLIIGCAREWVKYFALCMPSTLAIIVTVIASLTLAHFIAKRVNETVDEASKVIAITNRPNILQGVLSYAAICALIFSALHIISFSWSIVIAASAFIALETIAEYLFNDNNVFENLANRICLFAHGAGESLVPTAGMQGILPGFMLPFWALALTIFEVLEDSNHNHELDKGKYVLPNLKDLGVSADTVNPYLKHKTQLVNLGYEVIKANTSPGMDFATIENKNKISSLIKSLKESNYTITIEQAVSLIFMVNHKISAKNLLDAGFNRGEIIAIRIFSKAQLYSAKIKYEKDYKAEITAIMLQQLAQDNKIKVEYLKAKRVEFSELEIVDSNVFTDKQLLTLGLDCDYYSSQLSFAIMLTLASLIFIHYNLILLVLGLIVVEYYSVRLYAYEASTELKFSRLAHHFTYYASYITAFSLGVNGGIECLNVFGSGIGVAIALAIFGAIIESSVYFNELMSDDDSHNHGSILDCIPSLESCILYTALCMVGAALFSVAILFNLPIVLLAQISIMVLPLIFKDNYDQIHAKAVSLLNNTSGECSVAAMIILVNAVFSVTTTLGYSIVFMPMSIPGMILILNALLLILINKQDYMLPSSEVIIDSIRNKFDCGCPPNSMCPPLSKAPSFSSLLESWGVKVGTGGSSFDAGGSSFDTVGSSFDCS